MSAGKAHEDVIDENLYQALHYARIAGSPSLELKIRLAQLHAGLIDPMTPDEVEAVLDKTQGCVALKRNDASHTSVKLPSE